MPVIINSGNRIVSTVGKHVIAQQALSSRSKCVGVEESTQCGVVIAGLAVVKLGFRVVIVAPVAEGVLCGDGRGVAEGGGLGGENLAPGVVNIADYCGARCVHQTDNITLKIQNIVVRHIVQDKGVGPSALVIQELHDVLCAVGIIPGLPDKGTAVVVEVGVDRGSIGACHTLGDPQTVLVIDIVDGEFRAALLCLSQLPSVPLEVPPGAVVVAGGVADGALGSAMDPEDSMAL